MLAELVKQYNTLKRCGKSLPDPYFKELPVFVEIVLKQDGSLSKVEWICKPKEDAKGKKSKKPPKEEPVADVDCPVTERSACRSSGNDSPHGLVDNPSWIFGEFAPASKDKKKKGKQKPPGMQRAEAFRKQLNILIEQFGTINDVDPDLLKEEGKGLETISKFLSDNKLRSEIWGKVESLLREKIQVDDPKKWSDKASNVYIRWVIEKTGAQGMPINAMENVKRAWVDLQKKQAEWTVISIVDGKKKPARLLHPKVKGASLVSFNDPATYCGHLHVSISKKQSKKCKNRDDSTKKQNTKSKDEKGEEGSALPAQIGFEEAEKYAMALKWLIENSSVRFGDAVNCIWVDQAEDSGKELDKDAHDLMAPQSRMSVFTRGKAKKGKGQTLADAGDLIKALRLFRNGQQPNYRDKRFYLLSILLRQKGRHALLGGFNGTMGELEDNTNSFIASSIINIPKGYPTAIDEPREFCPTLMDILDAAGMKSERKKRLVWEREIIEVIVRGSPLPPDLCRIVVLKAINLKHQEQSKETRIAYRGLLAIAAGCARNYLFRTSKKEGFGMEIDKNIKAPGYLAGRLFAVCENIQKRGRSWQPTLSDKLFPQGINRPRETLVQLYMNCRCYEMYKEDTAWFEEIFEKIRLFDTDTVIGAVMPAQGLDAYEFLLGYWHQLSALKSSQPAKASIKENKTDSNE